jgi:tripartite-type tricarboxylate transporter receptor subunit TctC
MQGIPMRPVRSVLALLVLALHLVPGHADETYPNRPIAVVVPYPPGGIVDVRVRQITEIATRQSGWRFVIENRPGGIGTIGASYAARAKPDGYTILSGSSSELNLVPAYGMKLDFDPQKAFVPITQWVRGSMLLVVPSSLGVDTVEQLLALGRKQGEPLMFGSAGPGSITFFAGKVFEKKAGLTFLDVPYKGSSQALLDLIPGRIQFQFDFVPTSLPHIRAGKLKPLLVTSHKRVPLLPQVPTATEAGFPDLAIATMSGFFAPRGTPESTVRQLHRVLAAAITSSELEKLFAEQGADAIGNTPDEFAAAMVADRKRWDEIIRLTGIHAE